jgi:hypothetical protein
MIQYWFFHYDRMLSDGHTRYPTGQNQSFPGFR